MPKIITKYGNGYVHVSVKGDAIEIAWENTGENITIRTIRRIDFAEIFNPLRVKNETAPSWTIDTPKP